MKEKATRKQGSSVLLCTKEMTLVSYVPNTSKTIKKLAFFLFSQRTQPYIGLKEKPEVIEICNTTKGRVNTFVQLNPVATKQKRFQKYFF